MQVQRSKIIRTTALTATMLLMLLLAPTSALADTDTVVVRGDTAASENDPGGWLFDRDQMTSTDYEFTAEEASIGTGSIYVRPIGPNPSDKFIAENFLLSSLDDLEEISYDFLIGPNSRPGDPEPESLSSVVKQFYVNVYTNQPGTPVDNFYQCRFDYVADPEHVDDVDDWTTMTITPDTAADVVKPRGGATCPETLGEMPPGSTVRMFALNLGDSEAGDAGLDGYFDNVVVTQSGDSIVYDFEASPADKDACKKGGFADYSFRNQGQCVSYVASHGRSS